MQWPTAGEWVAFVVILITLSLVLGLIETWWESRKENKKRGGRGRPQL